ncbi:hypothetical protein TBLA_0C06350 [Henningerozyma blattae CBS 6284]|uniref:Uncharacterized protein n=1 Tax=Henningerozyma blattae (strain ATCC 34711 / CBS 6284 / DSM 70876 / NBRC 10599 / NRRL Y-10934 / UCD 77-7) TaxID=1071380 RepID=I2H228_HENB6|nr:hypothetical protein TBLA_0C06350 [Tetrapisispora blattae CBS 6284]CCH60430.1 hypothetical protein TBLA_0C06350 [Tetrapisispora blattae CBS 6284]
MPLHPLSPCSVASASAKTARAAPRAARAVVRHTTAPHHHTTAVSRAPASASRAAPRASPRVLAAPISGLSKPRAPAVKADASASAKNAAANAAAANAATAISATAISAAAANSDQGFDSDSFLRTHIAQINACFQSRDYNKVNALYQSLKRNNIVPPLQIYSKILLSILHRDLDLNDINYKVFQLLNCYQDIIIKNKIAPNDSILNILLIALFKCSIVACHANNLNGTDFYKIALNLLSEILPNHNNNLSQELLQYFLVNTILYPGYIDCTTLQSHISQFNPDIQTALQSQIHLTLLTLARLNNNKKFLLDYCRAAFPNPSALSTRRLILATYLSALIETGEFATANSLLNDSLLNDSIQDPSTAAILLPNTILSYSKINPLYSFQLFESFNTKSPHLFDHNFLIYYTYTLLQHNKNIPLESHSHVWDIILTKLYPLLSRRPNASPDFNIASLTTSLLNSPSFYSNPYFPALSTSILTSKNITQLITTSILNHALLNNNLPLITSLLHESIENSLEFTNVSFTYPLIFKHFQKYEFTHQQILNFVNIHASLINKNQFESLKLFNSIYDQFKSQPDLLIQFIQLDCFSHYLTNLDLPSPNDDSNLSPLYNFLPLLFTAPLTSMDFYIKSLSIYSIVISKLLESSASPQTTTPSRLNLFQDTISHFKRLINNLYQLHENPANFITQDIIQTIKILDFPPEINSYFNCKFHPGQWNKSYPLNYSSLIHDSPNMAIQKFIELKKFNYIFDSNTYLELIYNQKFLNWNIIEDTMNLNCWNPHELKNLINFIIMNCSKFCLQKFLNTFFNSIFKLDDINDTSLQRIITDLPINITLPLINFPHDFKSIEKQVRFKSSINKIYNILFKKKQYNKLIEFNSIVPIIDETLLLNTSIIMDDLISYNNLKNSKPKQIPNASPTPTRTPTPPPPPSQQNDNFNLDCILSA